MHSCRIFVILITGLSWAFMPAAADAAPAPAITGLQCKAVPSGEECILAISNAVNFTYFTLSNPDRLAVDLKQVSHTAPLALPENLRPAWIQNVRAAQFDPQTFRVVFDLVRPPPLIEVTKLTRKGKAGMRLRVRLSETGQAAARPTVKNAAESPPVATMSGKPVVVIDAGHGGIDPGAIGKHGKEEKVITLHYARALRKALLRTGRYRVALTRDDDRFILLRDRIKLARQAGGGIFISLHADTAPEREARGLSVYTLSEEASDSEAELLAKQENKADVLSGMDLSSVQDNEVAGILIDLAQRETKNKSSELALSIIMAMKGEVKMVNNTHRFAGFAVLKAPDIPSVLVELGFLTNPSEEKLLLSDDYQRDVIKGLVKGVDSYFREAHK